MEREDERRRPAGEDPATVSDRDPDRWTEERGDPRDEERLGFGSIGELGDPSLTGDEAEPAATESGGRIHGERGGGSADATTATGGATDEAARVVSDER